MGYDYNPLLSKQENQESIHISDTLLDLDRAIRYYCV
jgi:hypothetical protein